MRASCTCMVGEVTLFTREGRSVVRSLQSEISRDDYPTVLLYFSFSLSILCFLPSFLPSPSQHKTRQRRWREQNGEERRCPDIGGGGDTPPSLPLSLSLPPSRYRAWLLGGEPSHPVPLLHILQLTHWIYRYCDFF